MLTYYIIKLTVLSFRLQDPLNNDDNNSDCQLSLVFEMFNDCLLFFTNYKRLSEIIYTHEDPKNTFEVL